MGISNRKDELNKPSKPAAIQGNKTAPENTAGPQSAAVKAEIQYTILQNLIDSANIAIFSVDNNYSYINFNKSYASMMKSIYGVDIQPGNSIMDYMTVEADRDKARANLGRALLKGERVIEESYLGDKALSRLYFEVFHIPIIDPAGVVKGVLVLARDITRSKDMEEQLQRQAHDLGKRVRELNCLHDLTRLIEEKDNFREDIYEGLVELVAAGWQYPEITCARLVVENKEFATTNWRETAWKQAADIHVHGTTFGRLEICYLEQKPDSYEGPFLKEERDLISALAERLGKMIERKQAGESILRSKLLLQSVIDATPDFIYVKDFEHRFILVNRSFAQSQNLVPQDMIGRPDTDFFSEELCLGNPEKGIVGFHTDDMEAFQGHLVQNPGNLVTWADGSLHVYDTYKFPLTDQSGKIYAAMVFSRDSTERQMAEEGGEAARNALHRTLQAAIDTISEVVNMRDPSTAGHQRRVATLAAAIALEMKLDDSRIENLVMAAKIHDIGKIYVPAHVLSKPGKLTDLELSMIITHAKGSHDILWKAEFSQPVALMVLQHHERIDGSGYPNELKGAQMLTESKILAVADVVEAIASNRPYRTAFGVDKALEEILDNRGKLYDPEVVDACLKVFNDKGFKFE